jgi:hypothetical protein
MERNPSPKKKRNLGDGNFTSDIEMIGFRFDGIKGTVCLPPAKVAVYIKEPHQILHQKSVPLKDLQSLVGKLRHAIIILPAA